MPFEVPRDSRVSTGRGPVPAHFHATISRVITTPTLVHCVALPCLLSIDRWVPQILRSAEYSASPFMSHPWSSHVMRYTKRFILQHALSCDQGMLLLDPMFSLRAVGHGPGGIRMETHWTGERSNEKLYVPPGGGHALGMMVSLSLPCRCSVRRIDRVPASSNPTVSLPLRTALRYHSVLFTSPPPPPTTSPAPSSALGQ